MATLTLTDPLGRRITFHNHTWFGHILRRHPDLRSHRRLVEETITTPLSIRFADGQPADTRLYYGVGPQSGMLIVLAANVAAGHVLSAHLAKVPKPGAIEWSPPTP